MKTISNDIEAAAFVYWGENIPVEPHHLVSNQTPESLLISKELLSSASKEAKQVLSFLLSSPNEDLFMETGRVNQKKLRQEIRQEMNWTFRHFAKVMQELKDLAQHI